MIPNYDLKVEVNNEDVMDYNVFDLSRFLYEGGAKINARNFKKAINEGIVIDKCMDRLDFLSAIKDELDTVIVGGGSYRSVLSCISEIKAFIKYMEDDGLSFKISDIVINYIKYSEFLFSKFQAELIKSSTIYGSLAVLSKLFGGILEIPHEERLIIRARIKKNANRKRSKSKTSEKQNLQDVFKFGSFIAGVTSAITIEKILGELPLKLNDINGGPLTLYGPLKDAEWIKLPRDQWLSWQKKTGERTYKKARKSINTPDEAINSAARRYCINVRVCAELMMFIAQTGMNFSQAKKLKRGSFKYRSQSDDWSVTCYKPRRGGEVRFSIFKSYKKRFKEHLAFIDLFFPNSDGLFPLFGSGPYEGSARGLSGSILRKITSEHGVPWIPSSRLRNSRVNWILRRSGDENLTAEMAQNTTQVLLDNYKVPSQQRAMVEVTQFWNKHDPILTGALKASIINSKCDGIPIAYDDTPASIVEPNCVVPSGCLWCQHHRDVDSLDYVWSLLSFRLLKIEESKFFVKNKSLSPPVDIVIDRITQKINWFRNSSKIRSEWVVESESRVDEGDYHPHWKKIIDFWED
ncbi:hypothetical protein [Marinomonas sp.]